MQRGKTGTSMSIERRPRARNSGPHLSLPPRPNRSEYRTFKEQRAEIERLEWLDGDNVRANKERAKPTWESVLNKWQNHCDYLRAQNREKQVAHDAKYQAEKERRRKLWQETIAYCKANGLPSPNSEYYR